MRAVVGLHFAASAAAMSSWMSPCAQLSSAEACEDKGACQWDSGRSRCAERNKAWCFAAASADCAGDGCSLLGGVCASPDASANAKCSIVPPTAGQCPAGCELSTGLPMLDANGELAYARSACREKGAAPVVAPSKDEIKPVQLSFAMKDIGTLIEDASGRAEAEAKVAADLQNLIHKGTSTVVDYKVKLVPDGDEARAHVIASVAAGRDKEPLLGIRQKFESLRDRAEIKFPVTGDWAKKTKELFVPEDEEDVTQDWREEVMSNVRKMRAAAGAEDADGFRLSRTPDDLPVDDKPAGCLDLLQSVTAECSLETVAKAVSKRDCAALTSACCDAISQVLELDGESISGSCSATTLDALHFADNVICGWEEGESVCKTFTEVVVPALEAAAVEPTERTASPLSMRSLRRACRAAPLVKGRFRRAQNRLRGFGAALPLSRRVSSQLRGMDIMCATAPSPSNGVRESHCLQDSSVSATIRKAIRGELTAQSILGAAQGSPCMLKTASILATSDADKTTLDSKCSKPAGDSLDCGAQLASLGNVSELLSVGRAGLSCWPSRIAWGADACPAECVSAVQRLSDIGCCAHQIQKDWLAAGVATAAELGIAFAGKCGGKVVSQCPASSAAPAGGGKFKPWRIVLQLAADVIQGMGRTLLENIQKDVAEEAGVCTADVPIETIKVTPDPATDTATVQGDIFDPSSVITGRRGEVLGYRRGMVVSRLSNRIQGGRMRLSRVSSSVFRAGRSVVVLRVRRNAQPPLWRAHVVIKGTRLFDGCALALTALRYASGTAASRQAFLKAVEKATQMSPVLDALVDKFCATVQPVVILEKVKDAFSKCGPQHVAEITALQSAFSFCETEAPTASPTMSPTASPQGFDPSGVITARRGSALHVGGRTRLLLFARVNRDRFVKRLMRKAVTQKDLDQRCDYSQRRLWAGAKRVLRRSKSLLAAAGVSTAQSDLKSVLGAVTDKVACVKHRGRMLLLDPAVQALLHKVANFFDLDPATVCQGKDKGAMKRFLQKAAAAMRGMRLFHPRFRFFFTALCASSQPKTDAPTPAPAPPPTPAPFDPSTVITARAAEPLQAEGGNCFTQMKSAIASLPEECHPSNIAVEEVGDCVEDGDCKVDAGAFAECADDVKEYVRRLGCCLLNENEAMQQGLRGGVRRQTAHTFAQVMKLAGAEHVLDCPREETEAEAAAEGRLARVVRMKLRMPVQAKLDYADILGTMKDGLSSTFGVGMHEISKLQLIRGGKWAAAGGRSFETLAATEEVTVEGTVYCDDADDCAQMAESATDDCDWEDTAALLAAHTGHVADEGDFTCEMAEPANPAPESSSGGLSGGAVAGIVSALSLLCAGGVIAAFVVNRRNAAAHSTAHSIARGIGEEELVIDEKEGTYREPLDEDAGSAGSPRRAHHSDEDHASV